MATMERDATGDELGTIPKTMKAAVFVRPDLIELQERPVPQIGPGEALVRITTTTICGTDVHILKGEYPVKSGLVVGHEPVGVIAKLGDAVPGYRVGQRVIVGAITPCGQCFACLSRGRSQCGGTTSHGHHHALGGWRFGNTIDGCQAEYLRVPDARATLTVVPARALPEVALQGVPVGPDGPASGAARDTDPQPRRLTGAAALPICTPDIGGRAKDPVPSPGTCHDLEVVP